jgi:hypothetical protein
MNKSESISNLSAALAKFQAEVQNPKNTANNPFYKSKYAPLCDVLNLVRPLLAKYGLSVIQSPVGGDIIHGFIFGQNKDGSNEHGSLISISITTLLCHESGEWIEGGPMVVYLEKPTPQGAGSAISYARRYCLSSILGISSEDDDDGNHGERRRPNQQPQENLKPKKPIESSGKEMSDVRWSIHNMMVALCENDGNVLEKAADGKLTVNGKSTLRKYASDVWEVDMVKLWGKASTGNYTCQQLEEFRSKLHVAFDALKEQVA